VLLSLSLQSCLDSIAPEGSNNPEPESEPDPYSHTANPGLSANDFLADSNFTDLVIEIDYMEGYAPNEEALDSLKAFLEQRLHKTSITILEPTVIPAGGQDSYSGDEIRDLEEEHRDEFTENMEDDELTAYMIIVDGKYNQKNVVGIAYYNTSNTFFGEA
jgi:hypothetical protein